MTTMISETRYRRKIRCGIFLSLFLVLIAFQAEKPTLYIIGDSTVRNTNNGQWGWGTLIANYFDTARITISN